MKIIKSSSCYITKFTVALLNEYICKKKNVDNSKLWRVNVKKEDIIVNVSAEEDIKNKLKGESNGT